VPDLRAIALDPATLGAGRRVVVHVGVDDMPGRYRPYGIGLREVALYYGH